jgi:hypothetical protein
MRNREILAVARLRQVVAQHAQAMWTKGLTIGYKKLCERLVEVGQQTRVGIITRLVLVEEHGLIATAGAAHRLDKAFVCGSNREDGEATSFIHRRYVTERYPITTKATVTRQLRRDKSVSVHH